MVVPSFMVDASGMIGHQLFQELMKTHEMRDVVHRSQEQCACVDLFNIGNTYCNIDILDLSSILMILNDFYLEVVINTIGIFK